ncbi:aspartic proteinase CDR1-like, partial [Actinidia eriantha]|uniref:aspartic proteinase CDR1-like n=1 Tax=Actinidia eriantha TaxID=165200 RepID=UPI00258F3A72
INRISCSGLFYFQYIEQCHQWHFGFGCGHENEGSTEGQQSGNLGLGPGNVSLISQLGSKFSHCFGNTSDPNYSHSQLILGYGAHFLGSSTPLDTSNDLYYVTLEGLSVGEKRLIINTFSFRGTPSGADGVILDSATTITWLASGAFYPLRDEVKTLLGERLIQEKLSSSSQLCYNRSVSQDLSEFPAVRFHFANGTRLVAEKWSMFHQTTPDEFCMAVMETKVNGFSIIGLMVQQYHNVGYDVIGQKIYFKRTNCEHLKEV